MNQPKLEKLLDDLWNEYGWHERAKEVQEEYDQLIKQKDVAYAEEKNRMNNTIELLANIQHQIWSHWMKYQFLVCQENPDGSVTIPAEKVERWKRQKNTDYLALSEAEKVSDREQAEKIIKAFMSIRHEI